MAYYKHDGAIAAPPSRSGRGGGHGMVRIFISFYFIIVLKYLYSYH